MNIVKGSKLGKHGFGSLYNLTWSVTIMRTSCFDTDFDSQMKLTTFSLIHCFVYNAIKIRSFNPDLDVSVTYISVKTIYQTPNGIG